ncbi:bifunctional 2-polyprenyl-6-hydroxyphenol methylase/3-demethylubiquinol 3-O-methyltransferase UbiG [Deinococcus sp. YIM 77859]|uniref:class I SAM-dependent methyltransferase n=1 Tax=Deinococcus sp. YIM 77859 TaxID=1540221 RepID=UPI000555A5F4|nr:class I SAM-dependent methyltransferase [Deinococcus sp. YIM 77859]
MHWSHSFYERQNALIDCYHAPIHPVHTALAARVTGHRGQPGTLLELGAGGGQFAVAAALAGHDVTALELMTGAGEHTRRLAAQHGTTVRTLTADFYTADPGGPFNAVCYWDGFGIGEDDEQRHLLSRVAGWLAAGGTAYVDVYTPWYWAHHAGFTRRTERYTQTYGFDADGCRMLDTYAPSGEEPFTQSLRCYSPADLRLLLPGTGLSLAEVWPGGAYDPRAGVYHPEVPLGECMMYVAVLEPA